MSEADLSESTDGELLAAVVNDPSRRVDAWSTLVRRHGERMYAVARSFNFDAATAEDVVQTAWLRLLERPDQIRDESSLGPWLCMVVRNQARNLVTRNRTVPAGFDVGARAPADDTTATEGLIAEERAAALRYAYARLGERCQRLLRLLFTEPPLSYDEIAAATGTPRGSLGPTRRRCLDELRGHLPHGFEP